MACILKHKNAEDNLLEDIRKVAPEVVTDIPNTKAVKTVIDKWNNALPLIGVEGKVAEISSIKNNNVNLNFKSAIDNFKDDIHSILDPTLDTRLKGLSIVEHNKEIRKEEDKVWAIHKKWSQEITALGGKPELLLKSVVNQESFYDESIDKSDYEELDLNEIFNTEYRYKSDSAKKYLKNYARAIYKAGFKWGDPDNEAKILMELSKLIPDDVTIEFLSEEEFKSFVVTPNAIGLYRHRQNNTPPGIFLTNYHRENKKIDYKELSALNNLRLLSKTFIHESIHAITVEEYEKDNIFKKQVDDLYDIALNFIENNPDNEFIKANPNLKALYGFKNTLEFLAEALSNENFATVLQNIPYNGKTYRGESNSVFKELRRIIYTHINFILNNFISINKPQGTSYPETSILDELVEVIIESQALKVTKLKNTLNIKFNEDALKRVDDLRRKYNTFNSQEIITLNKPVLEAIDNKRKELGIYESQISFSSYLEDTRNNKPDFQKLQGNQELTLESKQVAQELSQREDNVEIVDGEVSFNTQNLISGLDWLKTIMPDVNPIIVNGLIDNIANGKYDIVNDLITLSKDFANKGVIKEEAFHRVFALLPKEEQEKLLNEGSKKYGIERGESKATIRYSLAQQKQVDYMLSSVDILQSDKAVQVFEKGKKANWDLNKILTELQIPKEQKQIILDLGVNDREQVLLELVNNYSFTVEINMAKIKGLDDWRLLPGPDNQGWVVEYIQNHDGDIEFFETEQEAKNFIKFKQREIKNTQHYSHLTVAGGTNYTEQEITTPLITPNSVGHAKFSTDNGIGWFRSDEQADLEKDLNAGFTYEDYENKYGSIDTDTPAKDIKYSKSGRQPNIRRILEVQSDLFQKGRDKEDLIGGSKSIREDTVTEEYQIGNLLYYKNDRGYFINDLSIPFDVNNVGKNLVKITKEEFLSKQSNKKDTKENQFLQLLNKDSNWVTFFIKSIIQDSFKQGYEKVLFPTGNTASKVEGHTTLEEFKKQKEDRIKELEKEKSIINEVSINSKEKIGESYVVSGIKMPNGSVRNIWFNGGEEDFRRVKDEVNNNEITQLKQELERVETEGFGALKPIYNFYENVVTNVLKKQGFNPVLITDEYGNTWNEITLSEDLTEKVKTIRLNAPNVIYTGDLAIEEKIAEEAYNSKDEKVPTTLIGKFIQSIRNMLRNLFKEQDIISRTIRNLNQGRISNFLNVNESQKPQKSFLHAASILEDMVVQNVITKNCK